ncbi:MAG: hypothetical protein V1738_04835 [Patescibacteria group bacterium]
MLNKTAVIFSLTTCLWGCDIRQQHAVDSHELLTIETNGSSPCVELYSAPITADEAAGWNALLLPDGWRIESLTDRAVTLMNATDGVAYLRISADNRQLLWSVVYRPNIAGCYWHGREQFETLLPESLLVEEDSYSSCACNDCSLSHLVTVNWPVQERFFTDLYRIMSDPSDSTCNFTET